MCGVGGGVGSKLDCKAAVCGGELHAELSGLARGVVQTCVHPSAEICGDLPRSAELCGVVRSCAELCGVVRS
eukprot:1021079-Rhodomonas_salina.3